MLSQLRDAGKCLDFWKINHIQEVFQQAVIIVTMSMMVMVARGKHLRRLLLRVLLEQPKIQGVLGRWSTGDVTYASTQRRRWVHSARVRNKLYV